MTRSLGIRDARTGTAFQGAPCLADDCDTRVKARGLCSTHLSRFYRTGMHGSLLRINLRGQSVVEEFRFMSDQGVDSKYIADQLGLQHASLLCALRRNGVILRRVKRYGPYGNKITSVYIENREDTPQ